MSRVSVWVLALGAPLIVTPSPVSADSDGYYCVGPDYVAYQLREWHWFNHGQHRLIVVRFDENGPRFVGDVDLGSDFQPHAMQCSQAQVSLEGWGLTHIRVSVNLLPGGELAVADVELDPLRTFDPEDFPEPLPNLGDLSRPGTVVVGEVGDTSVSLVIEHHGIGGPQWCREIETWIQVGERRAPPRTALQLYRGFARCEVPGSSPDPSA